MTEAQGHSYLQTYALLAHTQSQLDQFLEWPDNHTSITSAAAHGTMFILSFYQLLKG